MRDLYVTGHRSYGFAYDAYLNTFSKFHFKNYQLDDYKKYLLHLILHKYRLIWCEGSAKGFLTVLCKTVLKDKLKDTRVITRFHRVPSMMLDERGWKAIVPLFGSDIIVWVYDCSRELKELFPKMSLLKNFYVVHNGVDLELYRRLSIKKDEKLILTLSSWWKHKRLELLVEAMQHLRQYRLVGVGEFLNVEYKQFILRLAKNVPNVKFLGERYGKEKAHWMNKAGIFVMPSKLESWSTHTMEAMGCETPVLITEGGGVNEYVPREERLPKNITAKELAEKICVLTGDKGVGKKNRAIVTKYSWENVRKEVETVLEELKK